MSFFVPKVVPKTEEEIEGMRASGQVLSKALTHIATILKPGVSGTFIDREAETVIRDFGGRPVFKGYNGFPNALCLSLNSAVVHGIPSDEFFKEGDIISVDCGVELNGFISDSAYTFALTGVTNEVRNLLKVTKESLYFGLEFAKAGMRIGDIGFAIQDHAEYKHNYGIVRDLVGHGVGKQLHEPPEVPNFGRRGKGMKLEEGWTLAVEPMVNLGRREVYKAKDDWTIVTRDGKPSAHFEHTIVVRKGGAEILTDHQTIEIEIKNNKNIVDISENI